MKALNLFVVLSLIASLSKAQHSKDIILLTVQNDRIELAKAVKYLKACETKLICINVDLTKCDSVNILPSTHFNEVDTLGVIHPSDSEKILVDELEIAPNLLLPSELRRLRQGEDDELIGCPHLYPEGVATGFVNLIVHQGESDIVEEFQISSSFRQEKTAYHFAVVMAFRLNEHATKTFIGTHQNITQIDFSRTRRFKTYAINRFYEGKKSRAMLRSKIVILSVNRLEEYRLVPNSKKKMSTSEIFANIACQITGN